MFSAEDVEAADRAAIESLARRLADGDRDAFAPLFAQVLPLARRVASRMLENAADADDAVQQALVDVFFRAAELDPARPALPWILGIVAWNCRTVRRRVARRRESGEVDAASAIAAANPEEEAIRADLRLALENAVGVLAPGDAATLAAVLSDARPAIPAATFRKRLERALVRLRGAWRTTHGPE